MERYSRYNGRYRRRQRPRGRLASAAHEALGTLGILIVCAPGAAVAYLIMIGIYELGGML